MLVLSRKVGEQIVIGDGIVVTVTRMSNNRVTLGIDAPDSVRVLRSELTELAASPKVPSEGRSARPTPSVRKAAEAVELELCGSQGCAGNF